jgi:hypothetical protein
MNLQLRKCRNGIALAALFSVATLTSASALAQAQSARYGVTVPQINTNDRDQVAGLFQAYGSSATTADRNYLMRWTGSSSACVEGTTSRAYQNTMLVNLNLMRAWQGNANVMLFKDSETEKAQAAALVNLVNLLTKGLSHNPDPSFTCFSEKAAQGGQLSQLSGPQEVQTTLPLSLMDDFGDNNFFVGHRQVLTDSEQRYVAIGAVAGTETYVGSITVTLPRTIVALLGNFKPPPASEPKFVRWPAAGYSPFDHAPASSQRWSVGCPDCDATGATVRATLDGVPLPVVMEPRANVGGSVFWNTAVFRVEQVQFYLDRMRGSTANRDLYGSFYESKSDTPDTPINVTVSGIKAANGTVLPDDVYTVTLINPKNTSGKILASTRYDGLWQAAGEEAGLHLTNTHTGAIIGTWLTYAADGSPTWYTLADGRFSDVRTFAGKLFVTSADGTLRFIGGATLRFNGDSTVASGATAASFDYTLDGVSGSRNLTRTVIGPEAYEWGTHNFTGAWTAAQTGTSIPTSEHVSRLLVSQDYRSVYAAWVTLENGRPTWYRALPSMTAFQTGAPSAIQVQYGLDDAESKNRFVGTLQRTVGTPPPSPWNSAAFSATNVGTIAFGAIRVIPASPLETVFLPEENKANLSLTINGQTTTQRVDRNGFTIYHQGNANVKLSARGGIDIEGNGVSSLVVRNAAAGQMMAGKLINDVFQWTSIADPGPNFRIVGAVDLGGTGKSDLIVLDMSQPGEFGDVTAWKGFSNANTQLLRRVKKLWDAQALGDMDGDGKGDIGWRWTGDDADWGVTYIWFTDVGNAATPVNQVRKRGGAPLSWKMLGAMDVNQDGAADMVYISPDKQIRVLMATGSREAPRTCANFLVGTIPDGYDVVKYADFTGARRGGDILIRNATTGETRIISIVGNGVQLPKYTGAPDDRNASCTGAGSNASLRALTTSLGTIDPTWSYFASGDFNGDGTFDVAWRKPDGALAVTLMRANNGPRLIANAGLVPAGFSPIPLQ